MFKINDMLSGMDNMKTVDIEDKLFNDDSQVKIYCIFIDFSCYNVFALVFNFVKFSWGFDFVTIEILN